jgi:anti-anti-sigma factor
VADTSYPVRWTGRQAVVTLPGHIDVSNASQLGDELLFVIDHGAVELVVDMTATTSCDYAGVGAIARAYQRGAASGTQLRLVVAAPAVRRVLSINGLDRLIPIYPSLEAATPAAAPAAAGPGLPRPAGARPGGRAAPRRTARARRERPARTAAVTAAVLWRLVDALADGVALTDADGRLVLANRRLEDMFGYEHAALVGRPVESLIPDELRAAHRGHRAGYAQEPRARPMGAGARLVGLRKDGATFPVSVSLSPVPTATGHLTLAVVRDVTETPRGQDLAAFAQTAAAAGQEHPDRELLDRVVEGLFQVGLSLQEAIDRPNDVARLRITEALRGLDDAIHQIRSSVFATRGRVSPSGTAPSNGA